MRTHTNSCTRTYMRIRWNIRIHTFTGIQTHIHIHMHTCTYAQTYKHAHACKHEYTCKCWSSNAHKKYINTHAHNDGGIHAEVGMQRMPVTLSCGFITHACVPEAVDSSCLRAKSARCPRWCVRLQLWRCPCIRHQQETKVAWCPCPSKMRCSKHVMLQQACHVAASVPCCSKRVF